MLVQADRADLGPAFTWLLFDAQDAKQSARKERAFNFVPKEGLWLQCARSSAGRLSVHGPGPSHGHPLGGGGGHSRRRGGLVGGRGAGDRAHQRPGGRRRLPPHRCSWKARTWRATETVLLRLRLPPTGSAAGRQSCCCGTGDRARMALAVADATPAKVDATNALLEIGPVAISPGGSATVETLLLVQVPAGERAQLVAQARELAASRMAPTLRDTARSWAAVSSVSTRDRTVQEIFDKARFGLAGMIGPDGTMDAGMLRIRRAVGSRQLQYRPRRAARRTVRGGAQRSPAHPHQDDQPGRGDHDRRELR